MTFDGRIEALFTVPDGVAVTGSANGTTNTVPLFSGSYYLNAAGGVDSLLQTFADQLNAYIPPSNYPGTAAQMASSVGFGTWSAGWLCDDTSGSLQSAFGAPNATPLGTPVYGLPGPRGGSDLAVGFSKTNNDGFSAGNTFNVGATDDVVVAWVAKWTATPANCDVFNKYNGTGQYQVRLISGAYRIDIDDGAGHSFFVYDGTLAPINKWHVVIMAIDRTAGKVRMGFQALDGSSSWLSASTSLGSVGALTSTANFVIGSSLSFGFGTGAPTTENLAAFYIGTGSAVAAGIPANLSTALTNFATAINAGWQVSLSTGKTGTGQVSINCIASPSTPFSIVWGQDTTFRDLLGFTADITSASSVQTGAKQARGLWIPDAPLNVDSDPKRVPKVTDQRQTKSPTGRVLSLIGNWFYQHTNITWQKVNKTRVWESEATLPNSSWEFFHNETQLGLNSSWFTGSTPVQIYDHTGTLVGIDRNGVGTVGWQIVGVTSINPKRFDQGGWTGLWDIVLPEIDSAG